MGVLLMYKLQGRKRVGAQGRVFTVNIVDEGNCTDQRKLVL
jgi:hypothetical protein